jgi:hypothetical protein
MTSSTRSPRSTGAPTAWPSSSSAAGPRPRTWPPRWRPAPVNRPGAQPECCSGGQSGSSFSLRPDGDLLAYSPDGTDLRVAELTPPGAAGRSLWRAPARITATAFSSSWVAVAYGGSIALVSPDGTRHLNLASPLLEGVTSLDWAA